MDAAADVASQLARGTSADARAAGRSASTALAAAHDVAARLIPAAKAYAALRDPHAGCAGPERLRAASARAAAALAERHLAVADAAAARALE